MSAYKDVVIQQGKTFSLVLRWEAPPIVYKQISSVSKAAPCLITATGHGIPDGWRVAVVSVKGMTEVNAKEDPPGDGDYVQATVVDANTVELNTVNSAGYKDYVSGGYLRYNTPVDMTGFSARMKVRNKVGGTVLASTEVEDAPADIISVVVDNAAKTVTATITASDTAAIAWRKGTYDIEMVSGDATPVVSELLRGSVSVQREVTSDD